MRHRRLPSNFTHLILYHTPTKNQMGKTRKLVINPSVPWEPFPGVRIFGGYAYIRRTGNVLEILEPPRIGFTDGHGMIFSTGFGSLICTANSRRNCLAHVIKPRLDAAAAHQSTGKTPGSASARNCGCKLLLCIASGQPCRISRARSRKRNCSVKLTLESSKSKNR